MAGAPLACTAITLCLGRRLGGIQIVADGVDVAAEGLDHGLLHRIGVLRQEDLAFEAQQARGIGHALAVVAGGGGADA
jgi:hypothetical protein